MKSDLTRLVHWAQQLLGERLQSGDLAVDLTAGTGKDTLFLARQVGASGGVLSFDIQEEALQQTAALLQAEQIAYSSPGKNSPLSALFPGVHLLLASHTDLHHYLSSPPAAIIANLGYLPGGDKEKTTQRATTLIALDQALAALKPGGRIAVVAYVEHPGGRSEADAVEELFAGLSCDLWQVLRLNIANLPHAPFLLVAEKRSSG